MKKEEEEGKIEKKQKREKGRENKRKLQKTVKTLENFIKLEHFTLIFFKKNFSTRR